MLRSVWLRSKLRLTLAGQLDERSRRHGPRRTIYQIKARDVTAWNGSRQLGDLARLHDGHPFDYLIAVFFGDAFPLVEAAYKIPVSVVRQFAKRKGKRDVLIANGPVLTAPGVEDIARSLL
jgi:hypothetical protein